ncbi:DUF1592 domain-containing protein [Luteolibacter algae]|uniref:DUF1592 domain-containing protein n=1 Tax=Luteolibacter algae TaxID=454151 RepID=A0ABW5D6J0_9BACT
MKKSSALHTAILLVTSLMMPESNAEDSANDIQAIMPDKYQQLFENYCYECHDSLFEEGEVNLETLSFDLGHDLQTAETWQKILNVLNSGEMPPKKEPQVPAEEKTAFLGDLSNQMVSARKILSDNGGVITMRRLNQREYVNTMKDLLGVAPDVSELPKDDDTGGFDTLGASLFFSSDQFEQYMSVAKESFALAMRESPPLKSKIFRVEPEMGASRNYRERLEAYKEAIKRSDAFFAQKEKPATDFGFGDAYGARRSRQNAVDWIPQLEEYLGRPETKTGATLQVTIKSGGFVTVKLPGLSSDDAGNYVLRVRAGAYPDASKRLQYLEFTKKVSGDSGETRLGWRKIHGTVEEPEIIEFPVTHIAGEKAQYIIHQRSHQGRGDKNLWTYDRKVNGMGTTPGGWIDWVEIEGPSAPAEDTRNPLDEVFFEKPRNWDDATYARAVIEKFAGRASRTEAPSEEFIEKLFGLYENRLEDGLNTEQALVEPLSVILSSPSFLYMVESTGSQGKPRLSERELAVRLSYFLWSTAPDEELLRLADEGKLSDPEVLSQQTERMLADDRSDRFVESFLHQWLDMYRLDMFEFNAVSYRDFDNATRESARREIYETFRTLMDEKLPLENLLKSDFVVINDVLADYYGIDEVEGWHFRKVKVPEGLPRGGLLGTAAVLAMGSDGLRSSPVERGAWVLRHLLNDPPPPAPANVPQLSRLEGEILSARELQEAHQEEPQCAQCHVKIDPIGYGLENFDAAGGWRMEELVKAHGGDGEKSFEIDSKGALYDGTEFSGFYELRDVVYSRLDAFALGFTEQLISYGLGRPYGFTDYDLAQSITKQAHAKDYRIADFIHALVQSEMFQTK